MFGETKATRICGVENWSRGNVQKTTELRDLWRSMDRFSESFIEYSYAHAEYEILQYCGKSQRKLVHCTIPGAHTVPEIVYVSSRHSRGMFS